MTTKLFPKYFELVFWVAALVSLAFTNPAGPIHFSLCPLRALGITWCPGCGLGHSISWIFHGNLINSWRAHWFGIPALGIILYRVCSLAVQRIKEQSLLSLIK